MRRKIFTILVIFKIAKILLDLADNETGLIQKAKKNSSGLGLFVRSLIGLDRAAAIEALGELIKDSTANANQIKFLDLIVEELTKDGAMEDSRLYQAPFTYYTQDSILDFPPGFENNENSDAVLQGFTIQNGNGYFADPDGNGTFYTYGGGIYCQDSDPTLKDLIITNNSGDEGGGGGIFLYEASPLIIGCFITNNSTDDVGGGLDGKTLSVDEVKQLASLPSLDELRGKLVGLIKSPSQKLASVAVAPANKLVNVLHAKANQ